MHCSCAQYGKTKKSVGNNKDGRCTYIVCGITLVVSKKINKSYTVEEKERGRVIVAVKYTRIRLLER